MKKEMKWTEIRNYALFEGRYNIAKECYTFKSFLSGIQRSWWPWDVCVYKPNAWIWQSTQNG